MHCPSPPERQQTLGKRCKRGPKEGMGPFRSHPGPLCKSPHLSEEARSSPRRPRFFRSYLIRLLFRCTLLRIPDILLVPTELLQLDLPVAFEHLLLLQHQHARRIGISRRQLQCVELP